MKRKFTKMHGLGNDYVYMDCYTNGQEIEKIARNIMTEQGYDFDKEFNNFKQMMGL